MAASIRAHVNLQLFLAEQAIDAYESVELSDGQYPVDRDHALFHLQLAYRCHLADLCEQQQLSLRPENACDGVSRLLAMGKSVPELDELAEKETYLEWLQQLLAEDFMPKAELPVVQAEVIFSSNSEQDKPSLRLIISELRELFDRQRETQQEY